MILYSLRCDEGHRFDSWFPSSSSYESQRERGLVSCPQCGSTAVEKAVMAPSVARTDKARPKTPPPEMPSPEGPRSEMPRSEMPLAGPAPAPGEPAEASPPAPAGEPQLSVVSQPEAELRALMRKLREHVVKTSDYVGADFADLARKMHEGEVEHRPIYGEATAEEVKSLHEDEVEVFPLPVLPDDRN